MIDFQENSPTHSFMNSLTTQQGTPVLSVSEITHSIKQLLEGELKNCSVQGEISNFRQQSSGHLYFSLKDSQSQIGAVMFKGSAAKLLQIPKDGDQVIVKGDISVYPPHGKYQMIVKSLHHAGLGELLLRLQTLKKEIHKRGWFDQEHKKPLPSSPKTIGVITSPTGAAIQDILHVIMRRATRAHLLLNPVRVQGKEAPDEIVQAIEQFNTHKLCDVIILGRGGGSMEDLWAFNEEKVARAVFQSQIPIIAAVGHEIDHCIAEYVADKRAPTPSAAAEIVTEESTQQLKFLIQISQHLSSIISHQFSRVQQQLHHLCRHPLISSPYTLLGPYIQKVDENRQVLDRNIQLSLEKARLQLQAKKDRAQALNPKAQIQHLRQKLSQVNRTGNFSIRSLLKNHKEQLLSLEESLNSSLMQLVRLHKERFDNLTRNLYAVDPKNLLKKGYSIAFSEKDRSVILSCQALSPGDGLRLVFSDGEVSATIRDVKSERSKNK